MYKIAFFADSHLGYSAKCRINPQNGLNERVADGYQGFKNTIDQIIEEEVDLVVHGGDLFHRSHPTITDIVFVRKQINRLYKTGIPFYGNTGNHDFANERGKYSATASVDDPDKNLNMLIGPYATYTPAPGISIMMVSHMGIIAQEIVIPEPKDGEVSIFTSHGAAAVPGHEMFACVDSPGEAVIPYDSLTLPWDASLLGHYHQMGPLPGFTEGQTGQAWYAGSLLRRGFSDNEGGRGWLLITIHDTGNVTIERKIIPQRLQHDLSFIDASQMTSSEVEDAICYNLENVEIDDAIIRQRVINCTLATRRHVNLKKLKELTKTALIWQPEFIRPASNEEYSELSESEQTVRSFTTARSSDLPKMWESWYDEYFENSSLAPEISPMVKKEGERVLKDVTEEDTE